jgi:hypothetical protein
MQLQGMWGLSANQAAEFQSNWNELWWTQYNNLTENFTPSTATYQNEVGMAYWQWVNSTYSMQMSSYITWASVYSYDFPGNFEIPYFKSNAF